MKDRDRRRFFRIEDRLPLVVRRVSAPGAEAPRAGSRPADVLLDIDRRIAAIISAARVQAPAVGELADLLNRKLDHVIGLLDLRGELVERAAFSEHPVNISASGVGLQVPDFHEEDEALEVELLLPPDERHLRIASRAVRCVPQDRGGYLLQVEFAGIGHDDQEVLIHYIMRRQSQFLQHLRESRESRPVRPAPSSPQ